jgi:amino acid permease
MSGFRYVSLLSLASLFYILVVLLIELPDYARRNFTWERLNYGHVDLKTFQSFAITFFAFQCHVEVIPIFDEMIEKT